MVNDRTSGPCDASEPNSHSKFSVMANKSAELIKPNKAITQRARSKMTVHERHSNMLTKKDSSSSMDEETQDTDDLLMSKVIIQEPSSFQFEGVRFTPKVIEFSDAFEGKQFFQKLKLQNVGRNPVLVKIGEPSSFIFHINKHDRSAKLLPSGKCMTRTVSYVYHNDDLVQRSQIRVNVNGRSIDYPIIVRRATPLIEVTPPELDFKVINMGASAKTLKITITNSGGRGTKFAIDLGRNELDLVVNPPRGTIRAKNKMNVYVEMVGITEGEYYKEMWITTNEKPIRVPIIAEVMRPRLEVYHPNATGDFTLIDFPPTFVGTQSLDTVVLRNFSADMTPFVIFAEVGGELKSSSEARKSQIAFKMFTMSSDEGRLEPFESRIIAIVFKPIKVPIREGWHHQVAASKRHLFNEFLVFFRINRVHCIEKKELERAEGDQKVEGVSSTLKELDKRQSIMASALSTMTIHAFVGSPHESLGKVLPDNSDKWTSSMSMPVPIEDKDVVRLCLHGEAYEPDLMLEPNSLYVERAVIGRTETKVLKLTNMSPIEMKYVFHKCVNVNIKPSMGWLKPKKAVEVSVNFTPTFQGKVKAFIRIELFAKSAVLYENEKSLVCIKQVKVFFSADIVTTETCPKPNLSMGITPKITHEVGLLSDLVTYGSEFPKPYSALLGVLNKKHRPKWMTEELNKVDNVKNALIAFPNDRPSGLRSGSHKRICRTIFTGQFRYYPPEDRKYAFSPEEVQRKMQSQRQWNDHIRQRVTPCPAIKSDDDDDAIEIKPNPCAECFDVTQLCKQVNPGTSCTGKDRLKLFQSILRNENILPKMVLIPLSPVYLCNIKVEPKLIDFSLVAPNSSVSEVLKIYNKNPFPVSIRFIPGKSGVTLPDGDTRIVPPLSKKHLLIRFKTKDFGRYNGFLDYVINGSHQFKVTVSANVVPKTLVIDECYQNLEFGNYSSSAAFQPNTKAITLVNNLRSPIKFHWEMQSDSAFFIEPLNGEVPPMVSLMNYIYFNLHPEKSHCAEANLVSEGGAVQPIKLVYRKQRSTVFFIANKIEMREIPLNLVERIRPTIKNQNYYDVAFEVIDFAPMPGVKVFPRQEIIKARSTFDLVVEFQIPVIIDFQFDLKVRIQHGYFISIKICGSVACPQIRLIPMEVTMPRISAQSFDMAPMCVENVGTTRANITINFKEYPEYRISRRKDMFLDDVEDEVIQLPPEKSFRFFLHFEPTDVARYQFYLPIVINGILGPPMMQDSSTEYLSYYLEQHEKLYEEYGDITRSADLKIKIPCACINSTVMGHLLNFSSLRIEFQQTANNVAPDEDLELTNLHNLPVTLCVRMDDLNQEGSPFGLTVVGQKKVEYHAKSIKITLQAGEMITFRIAFKPTKPGCYVTEVPVFLRGFDDGYAHNIIHLSGNFVKPRLFAEAQEIHFPPVPLRVGTELMLQVHALHYRSPDVITYTIWDVEEYGKLLPDMVKIVWLDEPRITGTQESQSFCIQVSFISYYPIGLRAFIVFNDTHGEYFPVLLTAIADNCSATNHIFLSTRSTKYKLIHDDSSPILEDEPSYYTSKQPIRFGKGNGAQMKKTTENPAKKNKSKLIRQTKSNQMMQVLHQQQQQQPFRFRLRSDPVVQRMRGDKQALPLQYPTAAKVDPGPKLVIQMTKSMQRITQLNFVALRRTFDHKKKESNFPAISSNSVSHTDLTSDSTKSSLKTGKGVSDTTTDVTYPMFPNGDDNSYYEKYLIETAKYVELWVFEVGFHCEEYLSIPNGFQMVGNEDEPYQRQRLKEMKGYDASRKTILDLVAVLVGPKSRQVFPDKPIPPKDSPNRADHLYMVFSSLIHFLNIQGAYLPHVRPEHLLCYSDYIAYISKHSINENIVSGMQCNMGTEFLKRRVSPSVASGMSRGTDKEDPPAQEISIGALNDMWNKTLLEDDGRTDEESGVEGRDRRIVEIDDTSGYSSADWKRAHSVDYSVRETRDYVFVPERLDERSFNLRSTQAWLDVLIQMFRSLVIPKIVIRRMVMGTIEIEDKFSTETLGSSSYSTQDLYRSNRTESIGNLENYESNMFSIHERVLIYWLNHHYELQRHNLWSAQSETDHTPEPRTVENFKTDLSDSLILMAVTASYCPYLIPNYFSDVFPVPESYEQIYHNAIKLTTAWRVVNIGLTVEPRDIVHSNTVFMLMIVCHLYDVLPLLYPRSIVRFAAPLTGEITRTIELTNKAIEKIVYEAKFIGDQEGSFRLINAPTLLLKPGRHSELKIAFRAKRIHKVSVTLLLDGSSVSPHFAKSMVFHLEGEPSDFTEYTSIRLQGALYKVTCLDITITPPYSEPAMYEISYGTVSPNAAGKIFAADADLRLSALKPWREIWNRKTSRRLFINQSHLVYSGDTPATLNVTIACLTIESRNFWLLFRSEVGDFIVRINVIAKVKEAICGPLPVVLSEMWSENAECTCLDVERNLRIGITTASVCPLLCHMRVPARNDYLWDTMFVMFQKTLDSKEKVFWKKHFETNIGIRLIKWLLSQDESPEVVEEFVPSLRTSVTYSLKFDSEAEKYVKVMPTMEIPDVRSHEPVYLPIHVSNKAPPNLKAVLTMTSDSKKEIRTIKYAFQTPMDGLCNKTSGTRSPKIVR